MRTRWCVSGCVMATAALKMIYKTIYSVQKFAAENLLYYYIWVRVRNKSGKLQHTAGVLPL